MNRGLLAVAAVTALVVGGMLGPCTPGAFAAPGGGRALCIPLLMDCSSDGGGSGDGGGVLDGVDGVVDGLVDGVTGAADPTAALPTWGQRTALRLLNAIGWTFYFKPLPGPHGIAVVYPHTSNWDFFVGLLAKWAVGLQFRWLAKDSLFRGPMGPIMRYWGGVAVDRSSPQGAIVRLAQTMRAIHNTSAIARVRSACSRLSETSSSVLLVLRLSSLTVTSPFLVLTTTRSPLRTGASGETTMMSPLR